MGLNCNYKQNIVFLLIFHSHFHANFPRKLSYNLETLLLGIYALGMANGIILQSVIFFTTKLKSLHQMCNQI